MPNPLFQEIEGYGARAAYARGMYIGARTDRGAELWSRIIANSDGMRRFDGPLPLIELELTETRPCHVQRQRRRGPTLPHPQRTRKIALENSSLFTADLRAVKFSGEFV